MFDWPTGSDYRGSIQSPTTCFSKPFLRKASAVCGIGVHSHYPQVSAGNYAVVFNLKLGDKHWAVRCFTRRVTDQEERYKVLSSQLRKRSPYLIDFEYIEKGIFVNDWYPLVIMDWVEGKCLDSFIEENLGKPDVLQSMAEQWRKLLVDLHKLHVAHGDLQHGNILVEENGIKLVDYDDMYVPAFAKRNSPELGLPAYQHPQRTVTDYGEFIDNFSGLVIYCSLLGVAKEPSLWARFNTGQNLILTRDDFLEPTQSQCFTRLSQSSDPQVVKIARVLMDSCSHQIKKVPFLEDVLVAPQVIGSIVNPQSVNLNPAATIPVIQANQTPITQSVAPPNQVQQPAPTSVNAGPQPVQSNTTTSTSATFANNPFPMVQPQTPLTQPPVKPIPPPVPGAKIIYEIKRESNVTKLVISSSLGDQILPELKLISKYYSVPRSIGDGTLVTVISAGTKIGLKPTIFPVNSPGKGWFGGLFFSSESASQIFNLVQPEDKSLKFL